MTVPGRYTNLYKCLERVASTIITHRLFSKESALRRN